jgi:hypothetical protein
MLSSRFDTFATVVNFIDEVGCHEMSQWDCLKHPNRNCETFRVRFQLIDKVIAYVKTEGFKPQHFGCSFVFNSYM